MKYLFLSISLFLSFFANANTTETIRLEAEKIIKKLYATNGNYIRGAAPAIIIVEGKQSGASYSPSRHKIQIDKALVEMCAVFGKESEDALAYILAHELAHSYQKELKETSFWEYHLHKDCTKNEEREADIFGIFNAYLAGYKTVKLVPKVIAEVYKLYELKDNLSGYPPKEERMEVANSVQEKVEELIQLYESANYLSSIGKYDLAAASYKYILQFYQGREIYNNLGVNYTLQSMNFTNKDYDLYLYPMEIDWSTRMKKPKVSKGDDELTFDEQKYRNRLLMQALDAFAKASQLDKRYFTAEINSLCVMNLMGDYLETIKRFGVLEKNGKATIMGASTKQTEKMQLAAAIAKAHLPTEKQSALNIWDELEKSEHQEIAYQASYNILVFQEGKCGAPDDYSCWEPFPSQGREDGVMLHRISNFDESQMIHLDETDAIQVSISKHPNSTVFRYFAAGKPNCSLQQIDKPKTNVIQKDLLLDGLKLNVLTSTNGYLLNCAENKSVFLMSSENKPLQWAKYYLH